jgi:hypothetical protein
VCEAQNKNCIIMLEVLGYEWSVTYLKQTENGYVILKKALKWLWPVSIREASNFFDQIRKF